VNDVQVKMMVEPQQARMLADLASDIASDERRKGYRNNARDWEAIASEAAEAAARGQRKRRKLGMA
jgi:hypothetical protein